MTEGRDKAVLPGREVAERALLRADFLPPPPWPSLRTAGLEGVLRHVWFRLHFPFAKSCPIFILLLLRTPGFALPRPGRRGGVARAASRPVTSVRGPTCASGGDALKGTQTSIKVSAAVRMNFSLESLEIWKQTLSPVSKERDLIKPRASIFRSWSLGTAEIFVMGTYKP